ncbi:hypothetical protein CASFOL_008809 [Castilleja foliolosa]|uniref:Uncharacterized protein n=1 Tax=Castilleja foliolosa TaxID=1961234 RepID=A0ABD3E033_9LAMI
MFSCRWWLLTAVVLGGARRRRKGVARLAYFEGNKVRETKALISELCRQFYHLGWVSGTGGSITIKVHDDSIPKPQQLIGYVPLRRAEGKDDG